MNGLGLSLDERLGAAAPIKKQDIENVFSYGAFSY
jgi:hypothetical protein